MTYSIKSVGGDGKRCGGKNVRYLTLHYLQIHSWRIWINTKPRKVCTVCNSEMGPYSMDTNIRGKDGSNVFSASKTLSPTLKPRPEINIVKKLDRGLTSHLWSYPSKFMRKEPKVRKVNKTREPIICTTTNQTADHYSRRGGSASQRIPEKEMLFLLIRLAKLNLFLELG